MLRNLSRKFKSALFINKHPRVIIRIRKKEEYVIICGSVEKKREIIEDVENDGRNKKFVVVYFLGFLKKKKFRSFLIVCQK